MAARKPRPPSNDMVRMTDGHRLKIANSNILKYLIEHIEGNREMSSTQVSAALGLMKKCLPDLANVDLTSGGEKLSVTLSREVTKL